MQGTCQFNTQGEFKCNANKVSATSKNFEAFSVASDAVMSYAANKCPESYQKKQFAFAEEKSDSEIGGYDPRFMFNKHIA